MRVTAEQRKIDGWYSRALRITIGCLCCFWAVADAKPATEPSDAHAPKPVPKKIPKSTLRLIAKLLTEGNWLIANDLSRWTPTEENDQVPSPTIRNPNVDISGEWRVRGGLDGSSLIISRTGPNSYNVAFSSHGCLGHWRLLRTGLYSDGVLVLDQPVKEYIGLTYRKLYAVRAGEVEYLVPDAAVARFQKGVSLDGSPIADGLAAPFWGFLRTSLRPQGVSGAKRESAPPSLRAKEERP